MRKTLLTAVILSLFAATAFSQGGVIPWVPQQFLKDDGNPCAGCSLYSYAAGTTTPQATYSDSALTTPQQNPIVLGAAGRPTSTIYLSGSSYKFLLTLSGGTTVWTRDNISDLGQLFKADLASTASGKGDALVGYLAAGGGAIARTIHARMADEVVYATDYCSDTTGVTDCTTAIQNAANAAAGRKLYFPKGTYLITDTILFETHRTLVEGENVYNTVIKFEPTSGGKAAFKFINTGGSGDTGYIVQCSLKNISFNSTDSTYAKTAVELSDASQFTMEDVHTYYPWTGTTGGDGYSIALHVRGRELNSFKRLTLQGDRPLRLSVSPNNREDTDHFHFEDLYLIGVGNTRPLITVDTGVQITNLLFDGYQGWANGSDGFYWNDTTGASECFNLSFNNVRWEAGAGAPSGNYFFYIHANNVLWNLGINNVITARNDHFLYLNKVTHTTIIGSDYYGTGNWLTADDTNSGVTQTGCRVGNSATLALTNFNEQFAVQENQNDTSAVVWNTAFYDRSNATSSSVRLHGAQTISAGSGTPESALAAPVGSLYLRSDGGVNTTLYTKRTGAGNTGWYSVQEIIGTMDGSIETSALVSVTVVAGTSELITMTATGADAGDVAILSATGDLGVLSMGMPYCETNVVKVRLTNDTAGDITLNNAPVGIIVLKY